MTDKGRIALIVVAVVAAAALLVGVASRGYRSLTEPPVVISGAPAQGAGSAAAPVTAASITAAVAQPVAPTASASDTATSTPTISRIRSTKRGRGRKRRRRSGKIQKLKDPSDGSVDIDTADANQLQRLPGVGPAMAQRILDARTQLGGFRKPDDLLEVRGIGPKKWAKMQPFVRT